MKKIIMVMITSFGCIFCSTQMKLNKSKDVDISLNIPIQLEDNKVIYHLQNMTNNTYIIDPYGFSGDSYWLFNNKKINRIDVSRGYYSRDEMDCENDLIILNPKQKIDTSLVLNYSERNIYDLTKTGEYIWNVKTKHSKENSMPSSCKQYINNLEKKGYIFLDDNIDAKIPFVKK